LASLAAQASVSGTAFAVTDSAIPTVRFAGAGVSGSQPASASLVQVAVSAVSFPFLVAPSSWRLGSRSAASIASVAGVSVAVAGVIVVVDSGTAVAVAVEEDDEDDEKEDEEEGVAPETILSH